MGLFTVPPSASYVQCYIVNVILILDKIWMYYATNETFYNEHWFPRVFQTKQLPRKIRVGRSISIDTLQHNSQAYFYYRFVLLKAKYRAVQKLFSKYYKRPCLWSKTYFMLNLGAEFDEKWCGTCCLCSMFKLIPFYV